MKEGNAISTPPAGHADDPAAIHARRWDPDTPHPARRYDYWLGGKDHFTADRASGDQIEQVFPHIRTAAIENRPGGHRRLRRVDELVAHRHDQK